MNTPTMTRDEALALVIAAAGIYAETITNDDPPHPQDEIDELWEAIGMLQAEKIPQS